MTGTPPGRLRKSSASAGTPSLRQAVVWHWRPASDHCCRGIERTPRGRGCVARRLTHGPPVWGSAHLQQPVNALLYLLLPGPALRCKSPASVPRLNCAPASG